MTGSHAGRSRGINPQAQAVSQSGVSMLIFNQGFFFVLCVCGLFRFSLIAKAATNTQTLRFFFLSLNVSSARTPDAGRERWELRETVDCIAV